MMATSQAKSTDWGIPVNKLMTLKRLNNTVENMNFDEFVTLQET